MTITNPSTYTLQAEDGSTYLSQALATLLAMASDIESAPTYKALALEAEQYELADAVDLLEALYHAALEQVLTGDHSALKAAMDALTHQVGVVLHHFAQ